MLMVSSQYILCYLNIYQYSDSHTLVIDQYGIMFKHSHTVASPPDLKHHSNTIYKYAHTLRNRSGNTSKRNFSAHSNHNNSIKKSFHYFHPAMRQGKHSEDKNNQNKNFKYGRTGNMQMQSATIVSNKSTNLANANDRPVSQTASSYLYIGKRPTGFSPGSCPSLEVLSATKKLYTLQQHLQLGMLKTQFLYQSATKIMMLLKNAFMQADATACRLFFRLIAIARKYPNLQLKIEKSVIQKVLYYLYNLGFNKKPSRNMEPSYLIKCETLMNSSKAEFIQLVFLQRIDLSLYFLFMKYNEYFKDEAEQNFGQNQIKLEKMITAIIKKFSQMKEDIAKLMAKSQYQQFIASLQKWNDYFPKLKGRHARKHYTVVHQEFNLQQQEQEQTVNGLEQRRNSNLSNFSDISRSSQMSLCYQERLKKFDQTKQNQDFKKNLQILSQNKKKRPFRRSSSIRQESTKRVSTTWGKQESINTSNNNKQIIKKGQQKLNSSKFNNNIPRKSISILKKQQSIVDKCQSSPNREPLLTFQSHKPFYIFFIIKDIIRIATVSIQKSEMMFNVNSIGSGMKLKVNLSGYFVYSLTFHRFHYTFYNIGVIQSQQLKKFVMANVQLKQKKIGNCLVCKIKLQSQSNQNVTRNVISQLLPESQSYKFYSFIKKFNVYFFTKFEQQLQLGDQIQKNSQIIEHNKSCIYTEYQEQNGNQSRKNNNSNSQVDNHEISLNRKQFSGTLSIYDQFYEDQLQVIKVTAEKRKGILYPNLQQQHYLYSSYSQQSIDDITDIAKKNIFTQYILAVSGHKFKPHGIQGKGITVSQCNIRRYSQSIRIIYHDKRINKNNLLAKSRKKNNQIFYTKRRQCSNQQSTKFSYAIIQQTKQPNIKIFRNVKHEQKYYNLFSIKIPQSFHNRHHHHSHDAIGFNQQIPGHLVRKSQFHNYCAINRRMGVPQFCKIRYELSFVKKVSKLGYIVCKIMLFNMQQTQTVILQAYLGLTQKYYIFEIKPGLLAPYLALDGVIPVYSKNDTSIPSQNGLTANSVLHSRILAITKLIKIFKIPANRPHSGQFGLVLQIGDFMVIWGCQLLYRRQVNHPEGDYLQYVTLQNIQTAQEHKNSSKQLFPKQAANSLKLSQTILKLSQSLYNRINRCHILQDSRIIKRYNNYNQFVDSIKKQFNQNHLDGSQNKVNPFKKKCEGYFYKGSTATKQILSLTTYSKQADIHNAISVALGISKKRQQFDWKLVLYRLDDGYQQDKLPIHKQKCDVKEDEKPETKKQQHTILYSKVKNHVIMGKLKGRSLTRYMRRIFNDAVLFRAFIAQFTLDSAHSKQSYDNY